MDNQGPILYDRVKQSGLSLKRLAALTGLNYNTLARQLNGFATLTSEVKSAVTLCLQKETSMENMLLAREQSYQDRGLQSRDLSLRVSTFNADAGTCEAVLASDSPVPIFDHSTGQFIDEMLLGFSYGDQIPLLDSHARDSVNCILGSISDMRMEGALLVGLLTFGTTTRALEAKQLVKEGHLSGISIGYRCEEVRYLSAGEKYTFKNDIYGPAKLVFRAIVLEASLCAIQADKIAKVRNADYASSKTGSKTAPRYDLTADVFALQALAYLRRNPGPGAIENLKSEATRLQAKAVSYRRLSDTFQSDDLIRQKYMGLAADHAYWSAVLLDVIDK
ncbi:MAG: hypothetical protein A2487_00025 [Candidatus Raymondbacteria bacterium RifOxyC12_full_50_8]|uniref:Uncharacterized protein n=1 Tax=Candidatus Raymondbacteria bacterium RIFOXYD12_FULL_49_13 TaxID=1817890 RepID=A0A1F7F742_UNCRA|nr:MAG: hypothetical protein A2248_21980 [Candidatus Raymondbacteria bacterium RIFOXYA2_FULL_49_16]OGJ88424.1 MAG: hypothetical protein A2350_11300 [Candidatus Raymondbacteria bacterium RifOxyB12_full_50_8]OGJ96287.1 MAG: hypothetical protein A2453_08850 [Candidatus Raymondbacteria bacterium RIFOXYC2_FULL_50_21]OGK02494.1 MAG: hypothetical protein A2519_12195 [Candidatus Raymondbacteria bacterium RIFOXYD12_FULL_49_13]OGK03134.1 MAG: hypothetical protein A2487_00025 [Candidatus Raymondbacteria b